MKRTLAEGVVTNYELVLKSKVGRKATVSFNASIFRSADGRVEGIFASARDISEQARLQTQLAEQQAYNRSLIEASADALFAISPEGLITDVNEEATRLDRLLPQTPDQLTLQGLFHRAGAGAGRCAADLQGRPRDRL